MTCIAATRLTHREEAATPRDWRTRLLTRRKLIAAVAIAVVVVEGWLLRDYLARAMDAVTGARPGWLVVAIVAEIVSMQSLARAQRRMVNAGGLRISISRMTALTYQANAVNATLPAGSAIASGFTLKRLRSWGVSLPVAGFAIVASGVLSSVAFVGLTVIGVELAGGGGIGSVSIAVAVAVVVLILALRRRTWPASVLHLATRAASRTSRLVRRRPEGAVAAIQRFAADLRTIKPRARDWLAGTGFAGLNWVADLVCLIASCRAVGVDVALPVLCAAYIAGMTASSLSILPLGGGVIDAAMILAFTTGGLTSTSATAGVIVYRLISAVLVVLVGWVIWLVAAQLRRRAAAR